MLAFDNDPGGDEATELAKAELRCYAATLERWRPAMKDWNEVAVKRGIASLHGLARADR